MSGFSRKAAAGILNLYLKKEESLTSPAKIWLALCTVVPTNSSTGATITEATGAEGYARKEVPAASMNKASEGETTSIKTSAEIVFNEITGGTATVIGWAALDSATTGAGNVIMWGTATSTVISATQTPPKIKTEGLVAELK